MALRVHLWLILSVAAQTNPELPQIITAYLTASNAHDVEAILACFSDSATVRDENETLHGKQAIKGWIVKTVSKYNFRFEPLEIHQDEDEATVTIKVSGTFPGTPITLDFCFTTHDGKISSLSVE